jgi:HAD superfamily hydrolase (TIGR01484 family)
MIEQRDQKINFSGSAGINFPDNKNVAPNQALSSVESVFSLLKERKVSTYPDFEKYLTLLIERFHVSETPYPKEIIFQAMRNYLDNLSKEDRISSERIVEIVEELKDYYLQAKIASRELVEVVSDLPQSPGNLFMFYGTDSEKMKTAYEFISSNKNNPVFFMSGKRLFDQEEVDMLYNSKEPLWGEEKHQQLRWKENGIVYRTLSLMIENAEKDSANGGHAFHEKLQYYFRDEIKERAFSNHILNLADNDLVLKNNGLNNTGREKYVGQMASNMRRLWQEDKFREKVVGLINEYEKRIGEIDFSEIKSINLVDLAFSGTQIWLMYLIFNHLQEEGKIPQDIKIEIHPLLASFDNYREHKAKYDQSLVHPQYITQNSNELLENFKSVEANKDFFSGKQPSHFVESSVEDQMKVLLELFLIRNAKIEKKNIDELYIKICRMHSKEYPKETEAVIKKKMRLQEGIKEIDGNILINGYSADLWMESLQKSYSSVSERIRSKKIKLISFDIDGTLQDVRNKDIKRSRTIKIPDDLIVRINKLLEMGIHIQIISGRNNFYPPDVFGDKLDQRFQSQLHFFAENGSSTLNIERKEVEPLGSFDLSYDFKAISDMITSEKKLSRYIQKISSTKQSMSIRPKSPTFLTFLQIKIKEIIKEMGLENRLNISSSGVALDINYFRIDKSTAVDYLAGSLGINHEEIMSFGDRGSVYENDYKLLSLPNGMSVGNMSNDINSSFPVMSPEGKQLRCYEGVNHILDKIIDVNSEKSSEK